MHNRKVKIIFFSKRPKNSSLCAHHTAACKDNINIHTYKAEEMLPAVTDPPGEFTYMTISYKTTR